MPTSAVLDLIHLSRPALGAEEEQAVLTVLRSGLLAQGETVARFEREFAALCGTKHAIATSSGTTALHTALLSHGIGPGDGVITTPFTFIATINSILAVGATPILADIDPETFNINPAQIDRAITPRTRAILPVHLFGHLCDMDAILAIARQHQLIVIEDAAQAAGATLCGKHAGSFGTGCFSFYATKNLMCGEGGAVVTDDDVIAERCRMVRNHGMRRRYFHEMMGYNFRMNEISAAIGLCQMNRFSDFQHQRSENAAFLREHLRDVSIPNERDGFVHAWHQFTVKTFFHDAQKRNALVDSLKLKGVETGIFYPLPVHKQAYLADRFVGQRFPVAEEVADRVLSLPVHPQLTHQQLQYIADTVNGI